MVKNIKEFKEKYFPKSTKKEDEEKPEKWAEETMDKVREKLFWEALKEKVNKFFGIERNWANQSAKRIYLPKDRYYITLSSFGKTSIEIWKYTSLDITLTKKHLFIEAMGLIVKLKEPVQIIDDKRALILEDANKITMMLSK